MKHTASLFLTLLLALAGCATYGVLAGDSPAGPAAQPRALPMFSGRTGASVSWADLMSAADAADVIILGEKHDDSVAHAVELAVVEDVLARRPKTAVSMEMFERDEQAIVNAWLAGDIDAATLVEKTGSANWGAEGMWGAWYQPIVDAAKASGAAVVAANCPRRYARLVRRRGFDALPRHKHPENTYFTIPRQTEEREYFERFRRVMKHHAGRRSSPMKKRAAPGRQPPRMPTLSDEKTAAFFRAQQLWDATMAASIVTARRKHEKVVHLVGQFHSDFDGGLVKRVRARAPRLKILSISLRRAGCTRLREDDINRADIVIYTGQ